MLKMSCRIKIFIHITMLTLQKSGCTSPLGIKDKTIPDSYITASSAAEDPNGETDHEGNVFVYNGHQGRLDNVFFWTPSQNQGSWVQVDFGYPNVKRMNGIVTQGSNYWEYWIVTLNVEYGNSADGLIPILDGGSPKVRCKLTWFYTIIFLFFFFFFFFS